MILFGCTTEVEGRVSRGGCRNPPPYGNQAEDGEGRSGLIIME